MKTFYRFFSMVLVVSTMALLSGCSSEGTASQTSLVNLSLTDAPIDDENVAGVYVTFTGIRYQYKDAEDGWQDLDLNGSKTVNLLELQEGKTAFMGSTELQAGEVEHIRFVLDLDNCYITFKDNTESKIQLEIPSGAQTGYKSTNGFTVAAGGTTNITADFDVRKSVTVTGNGVYKMKPTIRLVDNIEVGEINGTVSLSAVNSTIVVYAYADGAWTETQTDPANDFDAAVSSADATDGNFVLPWLEGGVYDLVVVGYDNTGAFENVIGFVSDVGVSADGAVSLEITDDTIVDAL